MSVPARGTPSPAAHAALLVALVATGLSAGFFHGWQVAIAPGLSVLDADTFVRTMNGINAEIRTVGFALVFFGSAASMALALVLRLRHRRGAGFVLTGAAFALYLVGLLAITFAVHVPMNTELMARTDLAGTGLERVRLAYESRWNAWHAVRSASAVLAFVLLALAVFSERHAQTMPPVTSTNVPAV